MSARARYRLIFFDLDGTLADTAGDIGDSLRRVLSAESLDPVPQEKVVASVGSGVRKLIERCLPEAASDVRERILRAFMGDYRSHLLVSTRLYPGVEETLRALGGITKVLLTNKPEAMARGVIEGLGIAGEFEAIFGGDTLPVRKPDPEAVNRSRDRFGVSPDSCLLVGDSRVDLETARAADIDFCAVTYGYHHSGEIDGAGAKITRFDDLTALVFSGT